MSWLLVAFTPGLLMLATFGLQRLEAGLEKDTVTATDVAEFLEQAEPVEVRTLAHRGMSEALDSLHRRIDRDTAAGRYPYSPDDPLADRWLAAAAVSAAGQPGTSAQRHPHSPSNRQFGPRQHANRV